MLCVAGKLQKNEFQKLLSINSKNLDSNCNAN
jgi:hypothetical protein